MQVVGVGARMGFAIIIEKEAVWARLGWIYDFLHRMTLISYSLQTWRSGRDMHPRTTL